MTHAINDHYVEERDMKLFEAVIEFYMARHSFANFARNVCRFSKDDIALVLNHIDLSRKTTAIYIAPDWSIIDQVQDGVLSLLKEKEDSISVRTMSLPIRYCSDAQFDRQMCIRLL